jgi:hypothetical protein
MASLQAVFVRYMTPLVPILSMFAATGLLSVVHQLRFPRLRPWLLAALGFLALLEPLSASVESYVAKLETGRSDPTSACFSASPGPSACR